MNANPSEMLVDLPADDIAINVDDVPVLPEITIGFIYGGQTYRARTPKDAVFLDVLFRANDVTKSNQLDSMMESIWRILAILVDEPTFEDIKTRYLDPDDSEATAMRLIKLVETLIVKVEEAMQGQMSGLFDQKPPRKPRKKPEDRKPKQIAT